MSRLALLPLVIAALVPALPAQAGPQVGGVSRIDGQCTGALRHDPQPLALASAIHLEQTVATGRRSHLEITFDDSTLLTLGEKAEVTIDRFVYDPGGVTDIAFSVSGAMRFVSAAGKPADADVSVTTPVAVIGIRGTDFWSGPIDGQYGVLLLDGAVTVSNPGGEVVLDEPGEGVNIAGPGIAPGAVTQWPQDKVERALAAVDF